VLGALLRIREQLFEWPAPDDAVLTTDGITGAFGLRDDGTFAEGSLLRVPLVTLKSDDDRRADAARETMNANRFRDATVKPVRATGLTLPLVVRLEGTNVELGKKILADSGLNILSATDMLDGAKKVVAAAKGGAK